MSIFFLLQLNKREYLLLFSLICDYKWTTTVFWSVGQTKHDF